MKHPPDHWDCVWARLAAEGVVEVPHEPITPFTSSCKALADWIENPGASRNIRVALQTTESLGGGE